jgi:SAM-dependent methyltransferase
MTLDWDYSQLAAAYAKRPGYCRDVLERCLDLARVRAGDRACDVGAGGAASTDPLLDRGLRVVAIEPNPAMRRLGTERTRGRREVRWVAARGEATGLASGAFDLVVFGSSFNVVGRGRAAAEAARLLRPGGWVACFFNHRRLDDPLQARIEALIHRLVPGYGYGTRREDQAAALAGGGRFGRVLRLEGEVVPEVDVEDWLGAWRSHATLARQAGERFAEVLEAIRALVAAGGRTRLAVPYTTRLWMARKPGSEGVANERLESGPSAKSR